MKPTEPTTSDTYIHRGPLIALYIFVAVIGVVAGGFFGVGASWLHFSDSVRLADIGMAAGAASGLLAAILWVFLIKLRVETEGEFSYFLGMFYGILAGIFASTLTHITLSMAGGSDSEWVLLLGILAFGGGVGLAAGIICSFAAFFAFN